MKGVRVRILKRFKTLEPFHSSKGHNTIFDHILQNHAGYKHRSCESNNRLSIKDVMDYSGKSPSVLQEDEEDVFEDCVDQDLHDEHQEMKEVNEDFLINFEQKCPPEGRKSVILYSTSLRGIRKTFEDCQSIKLLLDSFQIVYHERDISMHMEFRKELWELLGGEGIIPPKLFIKGKLIGGADEVITLHESGNLRILLQGIPRVSCGHKCKGCVNARFLLCSDCHGSRKVFHGEGKGGSFTRCLGCNENGLIKCPLCS